MHERSEASTRPPKYDASKRSEASHSNVASAGARASDGAGESQGRSPSDDLCGGGLQRAVIARRFTTAASTSVTILAGLGIKRYRLTSTIIGSLLSLMRITNVLDVLFVALRPKCGVLGGV